MRKLTTIVLVYVLGLATIVPCCGWLLVTQGSRDTVALLIVLPLAWTFGYFPTVVPVLTALRIRRWMKLLEDPQRLLATLREVPDGAAREEVARLVARELGLPRFVARKLWDRFEPRLRGALTAAGEV